MDRLPQIAETELKPGPERRRPKDHSCAASVAAVVWPPSLKRLVFPLKMPRSTVPVWQQLWLRDTWNRPIDTWNRPIHNVVWPASLQQLSFGWSFNQPILGVMWPASLQHLSFGDAFNQPIVGVTWPASLQQLWLGADFD
ncbi:unnamed protein product [Ectocarpus fasciculatus]